jgi:quinol monooxygenase YgiN
MARRPPTPSIIPAEIASGRMDGRLGASRRDWVKMVTVGILIRLQARPGREHDLAGFLEGVMPLIRDEPATTAFFSFQLGPAEFGIFNAFESDAGRNAHVNGLAAGALFGRAEELLAAPPSVEMIDILAVKLPAVAALTSAAA